MTPLRYSESIVAARPPEFLYDNQVPGARGAERGREFAFAVNGSWARWGYTLTPVDGGTQVTESWEFLPDGIAGFRERFGDDAAAQIADRGEAARTGIPITLAAIRETAEAP